MSLLGLDVGTTGCKAVLFHTDGTVLGSAYAEYENRSPGPGRFEVDSAAVWVQIKAMIQAVCAAASNDPLRALAIASMGEAVVPVTRQRQILGPSILNFDERGQEYLPGLSAVLSDERLYAINGNTLGNHYSLTKLMWMREHQPELYERTDYFLHWSSFVAFMLGAEPALDYSLANRTLLFDLERQDWSAELFAIAGLDVSRLPSTIPSGQVIGHALPSLAAASSTPPGKTVFNPRFTTGTRSVSRATRIGPVYTSLMPALNAATCAGSFEIGGMMCVSTSSPTPASRASTAISSVEMW